jgi:hypothetical protein
MANQAFDIGPLGIPIGVTRVNLFQRDALDDFGICVLSAVVFENKCLTSDFGEIGMIGRV